MAQILRIDFGLVWEQAHNRRFVFTEKKTFLPSELRVTCTIHCITFVHSGLQNDRHNVYPFRVLMCFYLSDMEALPC